MKKKNIKLNKKPMPPNPNPNPYIGMMGIGMNTELYPYPPYPPTGGAVRLCALILGAAREYELLLNDPPPTRPPLLAASAYPGSIAPVSMMDAASTPANAGFIIGPFSSSVDVFFAHVAIVILPRCCCCFVIIFFPRFPARTVAGFALAIVIVVVANIFVVVINQPLVSRPSVGVGSPYNDDDDDDDDARAQSSDE